MPVHVPPAHVVQQPAPFAALRHNPPSYVYAARFHPLAPSLVVKGAYDRGIRLWDIQLPAVGTGATGFAVDNETASLVVDPATAALGAVVKEGVLLGYIGAAVGVGSSGQTQLVGPPAPGALPTCATTHFVVMPYISPVLTIFLRRWSPSATFRFCKCD